MPVPFVGISTYLDNPRWGVWDLPAALLPAGYHELVQHAGGMATLLPPDRTEGAATAAVARIDALVIAGGPDVEPVRYGAKPHHRTGPANRERDAWEQARIEGAVAARVATHRITPVAGSRLERLLGGPVEEPTYHHQAVDRLGSGLEVSAYARDGTVEALESPTAGSFTLAVQWHPEAGTDLRVMRAVLEAAR